MIKLNKFNFKSRSIWDVENMFYQRSDPSRINKIICHYEIFKKTLKIPGSIIECGVFKGSSLIRFLNFRNLIKSNLKDNIEISDILRIDNFIYLNYETFN